MLLQINWIKTYIKSLPSASQSKLLLFLALTFSQATNAQGYEWVSPGEYSFGKCGRVDGGKVPGTIGINPKYYNKFSCVASYTTVDVCLQRALQIQSAQRQYQTLSQCSDWLNTELSNCRNFVSNAVQKCYQLAN